MFMSRLQNVNWKNDEHFEYRIGGIFCGYLILQILCFGKIYTQKKIYTVHTLFLTNLRNFNPKKYTPYMVLIFSCPIRNNYAS